MVHLVSMSLDCTCDVPLPEMGQNLATCPQTIHESLSQWESRPIHTKKCQNTKHQKVRLGERRDFFYKKQLYSYLYCNLHKGSYTNHVATKGRGVSSKNHYITNSYFIKVFILGGRDQNSGKNGYSMRYCGCRAPNMKARSSFISKNLEVDYTIN